VTTHVLCSGIGRLSYPPPRYFPHSSTSLDNLSSTLINALDNRIIPVVSVIIGALEHATTTVTVSVLCIVVLILRLSIFKRGSAISLLTGCGVYLDDNDNEDEDEEIIFQISGTWNFRCMSWSELLSRGSSLIILHIERGVEL